MVTAVLFLNIYIDCMVKMIIGKWMMSIYSYSKRMSCCMGGEDILKKDGK